MFEKYSLMPLIDVASPDRPIPDASHAPTINAKNSQVDEMLSILTNLISVLETAATRMTNATRPKRNASPMPSI